MAPPHRLADGLSGEGKEAEGRVQPKLHAWKNPDQVTELPRSGL